MTCFQLSESQRAAIDAFRKFLESDERVFMLKGAAGTGKTTVVMEIVNILKTENRAAVLMAPTGRAAHILSNRTGRDATTIHRGIYALGSLRSTHLNKDSDDEGGVHARFILKPNDSPESTVYIIDESSMVSDIVSESEAFSFGSGRLLSDLFEFTRDRKIVFVGDYAQLPPVGMNFSPALDKEYLEQTFGCRSVDVFLREVMRQRSGSVMLANADKIRDRIENKAFVEFSLQDGDDSEAEDADLLAPYYELSESKPDFRSAIIAYSNQQALRYNLRIRGHYFGENAERLYPGELLLIARNNYAYENELFNGNIVKVESCEPDGEMETRTVRVKVGKDRIESVKLKFRKAVIKFNAGGTAATVSVRLLDNFLDDPNGALGGLILRALLVDFENRLPSRIKEKMPAIKYRLSTKAALSQEQKEAYEAYLDLLWRDPYYNAVICKYGYAMTCHKAQGGEWDNVFVDMSRFGGMANEEYFRWAYTALTRASKKIWHFRSPDFNYISNIVVEDVKQSSKIKVSIYSADGDFCTERFTRIGNECEKYGVTVSEDRSKQNQHLVTFTDANGNTASFQLWFNAKGYSGKESMISATSDEFGSLCRAILDDSFTPGYVPFSAPDRPFAEKLVSFMRAQLEETGIKLLNITQEQYQDVFHLKTDGLAQVGLIYTAKGNYSYMRLASTLGSEDSKLQALRQRFI